jgi:hypothetical protein
MNSIYIRRCLVIVNIILLIVIFSDFEFYNSNLREGDFGATAIAFAVAAYATMKAAWLGFATSNLILYAILPTTWGMLALEVAMEVIPLVVEHSIGAAKKRKARILQLTGGRLGVPYVVVEKTPGAWEDPYKLKRKELISRLVNAQHDTKTNLKKKKTKELTNSWVEIMIKEDPNNRVPHFARYIEVPSFKCKDPLVPNNECETFQCDLQLNKKKELVVPRSLQLDWKKVRTKEGNKMQTTEKAKTKQIKYKYARLSQCYGATYDPTKDPLSEKYTDSPTTERTVTKNIQPIEADQNTQQNSGNDKSLDPDELFDTGEASDHNEIRNNFNHHLNSLTKQREKINKNMRDHTLKNK